MASLSRLSAFLDESSASALLASTVDTSVHDDVNDMSGGGLAVFYANCQGSGLAYWLRRCPAFKERYPRVVVVPVHDLVDRRATAFTADQAAALDGCDLLVYQPIAARHGPFGTDAVAARLRRGAAAVSFARGSA